MITRGSVVLVSLAGDYGKPRPAVVVQSNAVGPLDSVAICPMTTHPEDAAILRIAVDPDEQNGLFLRSYVMVEKINTLRRSKIGEPIGYLSEETMSRVTTALIILLGLA